MLGLFDEVSGSEDPMARKPENCRFVNPDVMLHAFHKYLENSLEYLEKTGAGRDPEAFSDSSPGQGPGG